MSTARPAASGSSRGWGVFRTLFSTEIRMLLRNKRSLVVSVLIPLAIWPLMILVMSWTETREEEQLAATTLEYAVTGDETDLARQRVAEALTVTAEEAGPDRVLPELREVTPEEPLKALEAGDLHLVVEGLSPERWREIAETAEQPGEATRTAESGTPGEESAAEADDEEREPPRVPVIRLHYRDNSDYSQEARNRVRDGLRSVRAQRREALLLERGFPVDPDEVAAVELDNVATAGEEAGAIVGMMLTPFVVLLMLSGGSIVAVDAISGEKERGTLETLLTTAATRWEIVGAKQAAIVAVGLAIAVINVANLLAYVFFGVFELPEALAALTVSPLGALILLLLFAPLAVLISSVLLLVSGYSKSYKEFQIYFFPVFLLLLLPTGAAVLPGIELRSVVSIVPLAGVAVAAGEVLTGEYDWPFLLLCFLSTSAFAAWLGRLTIRTLSTERLITAAELDRADLEGGPALFPRHVLRWFAVMWVILLVVSNWFGPRMSLQTQVLFNIAGIFLVGSLLMLWKYRLDVREALSLRAPPPAAWIAVLIGAPSGFLAGQGIFYLANLIFPVPQQVLEAFGQFLTPENLPLWQIVALLCVMPGIIEEVAFRGVLLHGLRKKLSPVALCLVTGVIFGLFHVSLFRLIPTAYMGVLLAAVVLLTGSILPAMLWHTLNNATALVPSVLGWFPPDMELAWYWPVIGVVGLAVAFGIMWSSRPAGRRTG